MADPLPRFHLAIPVHDLAAAREFYADRLGCSEGRSAESWVDFDLGGHQLVCHLTTATPRFDPHTNDVDGDKVPVPHFGLVMTMKAWRSLARRLQEQGVEFVVKPHARFSGSPGEQGTFFLYDPSGNALEFKGFEDLSRLFARG